MKGTRAGWVVLAGMLMFIGGCAYSQVSSYFLGIQQGDLTLYGFETVEAAAVIVESSITQADWKLKAKTASDQNSLFFEGTTRGGRPFKVYLSRKENSRGESWVHARFDMAGSDLVELRALLPAPPPQTNSTGVKPASAKK